MTRKLMLIGALFCLVLSPAYAQTKEELAVMEAAKSETQAFLDCDSSKWKASVVQNQQTTRVNSGSSWYSSTIGWKNLSGQMLGWMKNNPRPSRYNKIKVSNGIFHISDQLATISYDQELTSDKVDTLPSVYTREYRTLVKESNRWKVASILTYDTVSYVTTKPQDVEDEINALGYRFLVDKKMDRAIKIFKFNVEMYPLAWNPYDSLAEAYAAAGNKKLAIENYEKSVQLNPKNDNGIKMLKKLRSEQSSSVSNAKD